MPAIIAGNFGHRACIHIHISFACSCFFGPRYRRAIVLVSSFDLLALCSTKREIERLDAGIKEFDFECAILYLAFLPDELIKPWLSDFTGAVRATIRPAIFARRGAVQCHLETSGLAVVRRTQHQMQ